MKFDYFGTELVGFNDLYNITHLNERCIELAVAMHFLQARELANGLEVGNVLGHYDVGGHTVVDRYEHATPYQRLRRWPVIGVDVFDIDREVGSSWDWIVAISTLEHVQFDYGEHDESASHRAMVYLQRLLAPGGRMLVTVPCGFHPALDQVIVTGGMGAVRSCTYLRQSDEEWELTDVPTVVPYGGRSHWADAVWIGEFDPV